MEVRMPSLTSLSLPRVQPSRACGPFRYYESAWGIIPEMVGGLPQQTQNVLNYVKSEAFLSILIMVLW